MDFDILISIGSRETEMSRPRLLRALTSCVGQRFSAKAIGPLATMVASAWAFFGSPLAADEYDGPPIHYASAEPKNAISDLQARLDRGSLKLEYEDHFGYLRSVLAALEVPESSQMLVFSKTSLQSRRIWPQKPRAIYFNDDVYVGFCQAGDVMEVSIADPQLGAVFYTLDQVPTDKPAFRRQTDNCLMCHASSATQNIPGHVVRSVFPDPQGQPILSSGSYRIDHTSPLEKRWGGWYVTGQHGSMKHLGNLIIRGRQAPESIDNSAGLNLLEVPATVDTGRYLTPHSDIVALMVLEHQAQAHNLITRANFLTRTALFQEKELNRALGKPEDERWDSTTSRIKDAGEPLVKYLLFHDEAKLTDQISGTSHFAKEFQAKGPSDAQGRSLRELDLKKRMFRYPLSYVIYSDSFCALPGEVRDYVWQRLWDVLNDRDKSKDFAHLTSADRQAIIEIVRATHPELPDYWK